MCFHQIEGVGFIYNGQTFLTTLCTNLRYETKKRRRQSSHVCSKLVEGKEERSAESAGRGVFSTELRELGVVYISVSLGLWRRYVFFGGYREESARVPVSKSRYASRGSGLSSPSKKSERTDEISGVPISKHELPFEIGERGFVDHPPQLNE